jgi:hypothetical protein
MASEAAEALLAEAGLVPQGGKQKDSGMPES